VMLSGLQAIALDSKGRLAIPTRYRAILDERCQGNLVLTIQHHGKSLMLYPEPEFDQVARTLSKLSDFDEVEANLKLLIVGHAFYLQMDGHGRILIPPALRERAGIDLERKVMLVGQHNKLELWDENIWQEKQKTLYTTGFAAGVSEKLRGLSL
jgi:MraZ protein